MIDWLLLNEDPGRLLWMMRSAIEGVLVIITCLFIRNYELSAFRSWHTSKRCRFGPLKEILIYLLRVNLCSWGDTNYVNYKFEHF